MSDDIEIQLEQQPGGTVLRLKGNAGVTAGKKLELVILRLSATKPKMVIIDLSLTPMMASLVMGQLVSLRRSVVQNGGKLRLAAVQPPVLSSLQKSRLDSLFEFFPSVIDALKV